MQSLAVGLGPTMGVWGPGRAARTLALVLGLVPEQAERTDAHTGKTPKLQSQPGPGVAGATGSHPGSRRAQASPAEASRAGTCIPRIPSLPKGEQPLTAQGTARGRERTK